MVKNERKFKMPNRGNRTYKKTSSNPLTKRQAVTVAKSLRRKTGRRVRAVKENDGWHIYMGKKTGSD